MSFFRYPGGKKKLLEIIHDRLENHKKDGILEYREPFFGGGSVGISLIEKKVSFDSIWINDKDVGIACLWTAVINYPKQFKDLVMGFVPTIKAFDDFKDFLVNLKSYPQNSNDILKIAFMKLAIHQISYSGLGIKSGGPLGGREQNSKYKINCRWSPNNICKKIDKIHMLFSGLKIKTGNCTNQDFSDLINDSGDALIYLDPPYFTKGNDLYQCGFSEADHIRLSGYLQKTKHAWVLSYDDCDEIRDIYNWAKIEIVTNVNYSITATKEKDSGARKSRKKSELLIHPKY
jgi:DNA adenine methylase